MSESRITPRVYARGFRVVGGSDAESKDKTPSLSPAQQYARRLSELFFARATTANMNELANIDLDPYPEDELMEAAAAILEKEGWYVDYHLFNCAGCRVGYVLLRP